MRRRLRARADAANRNVDLARRLDRLEERRQALPGEIGGRFAVEDHHRVPAGQPRRVRPEAVARRPQHAELVRHELGYGLLLSRRRRTEPVSERPLPILDAVADLLRPYVTSMMAERFNPKRIAHNVAGSVRGWEHFVTDLPEDLGALLEQLRSGTLGVDFRVRDPEHAADHLVDGLVTSASLLAGAQLIARRAGPTVGGVSLPGLVVAGVGAMTWQRLIARRDTTRSWVTRVSELARARRD